MASIKQIGEKWRVQVRRKGMPPVVRTFQHKADAEEFAFEYEGVPLPKEIGGLKRIKPSDFIGVYFLFKQGKCVYVGQSQNVHFRVNNHRATIDFDEYCWIPVSVELLDETERKYIQTLFPAHNTASKPKRLTAHEIRREEMKSAALEIIHQKFSALKISRKFPRKQRKINADGKSG